jgi:hypothetical protein
MLRKLNVLAALLVTGSAALFAAGCASDTSDKPYALTGSGASYGVNGAGPRSTLTAGERARYTDQKGRFHPEWVAQAGR